MSYRRAYGSRLDGILERLAAAEERAFAAEFLAPMLRGGTVQVRIAGVVCRLRVSPPEFEGWGVFRPESARTAWLIRPARLAERRAYLDLLPILRVIVCVREGDRWLAIPADGADARFRIEGLVPVRLVEEPQLFDVLLTRFDGSQCWAPRARAESRSWDGGRAARGLSPGWATPTNWSGPGLTAEERAAYLGELRPSTPGRVRHPPGSRRGTAPRGAGARGRRVPGIPGARRRLPGRYEVDGRRQVSIVSRDNLSVQVAGISPERPGPAIRLAEHGRRSS